eukprot:6193273-Pleurochrysis_carterae.AAC.2
MVMGRRCEPTLSALGARGEACTKEVPSSGLQEGCRRLAEVVTESLNEVSDGAHRESRTAPELVAIGHIEYAGWALDF